MEAASANAEPVKPGPDLLGLAEQCETQMIKAITVALAMEAGPVRTAQRQAASEFAICASSLRAMHFGEHGLATLTEEVVGRLAHALQPPVEIVGKMISEEEAAIIQRARERGEIDEVNGTTCVIQSPGAAGKMVAQLMANLTGFPIVKKSRRAAEVSE